MKNEAKWTPGPWVIDPETRVFEVCTIHGLPKDARTDGQGWAYIRSSDTFYLGHDEKEVMANAHLIAAAPEMYEALEAMIDRYAPSYHDCIDDGMPECEICDARAAIAKARGEQP